MNEFMIRWLIKVIVLFIILTSIIAIGNELKSDSELESKIFSGDYNRPNLLYFARYSFS
jgi:hypothetical protein